MNTTMFDSFFYYTIMLVLLFLFYLLFSSSQKTLCHSFISSEDIYLFTDLPIHTMDLFSTNISTYQNEDTLLYKTILESLSDGIIFIDSQGIIKYVNPSAIKLLSATSASEIIGNEYEEYIIRTIDDKKIDLNIKNQPTISICIKRTNNQLMIAEADFIHLTDGYIISIKNSSLSRKNDRIHALYNKEKEEKFKMMEDNRKKSYFYSTLSHELRTPINLIFGSLQVLELYKTDILNQANHPHKSIFKHIELIKQNCFRMIRIVNNMIDINRLEAGFLKINLQNINIVSLLENITISASEYARIKCIDLIFETDEETYSLPCDPEMIERIMLNLISNALKFTDVNGTIIVSLTFDSKDAIISVQDSGIGIPQDKLQSIFNRFEQVDNSFVKNHCGSGIGLNLVKELVILHKGKINVTSDINKGTKFVITLPLQTSCTYKTMEEKEDYNSQIDTINIEMSDIYSGINAS